MWLSASRKQRHGVAILALSFGLAACDASQRRDGEVRRTVRGDTTLVEISAGADTAAVEAELEILWQDDRLDRPTALILAQGRIFVGDRRQVHILTEDGQYLRTIGRAGQGPEEFGFVGLLGALDTTVAVLDVRNARVATLDTAGAILSLHRLERTPAYVNPRLDGSPLRPWAEGLLAVANENVHMDRVTRAALTWIPLGMGDPKVIREWDDVEWTEGGRMLIPADAYGPRALVAVGEAGRYAWGDGVTPCVSIEEAGGVRVLEICRSQDAAAITSGVKRGASEAVSLDAQMGQALSDAISAQRLGEFFPSYDALLFGEDGRLWIRLVGAEAPDIHPYLIRLAPDRGWAHRRWEALSEDGSPRGQVLLPPRLDVRAFRGDTAYGFLEMESGELALARATWGAP